MLPILFVVAAQVASAQPPTRFELPNGLRVWIQEEPSRPVALVQVTYKVGSLHERPGATGIAHFVEHMVYRATENIRNEDIYGYIDRIGGRFTGGTWPEVTQYGEAVPSWAVESALRVTAERMSRAVFDSLEFERERSNVVTEANGFSEQDPLSAFRDRMMAAAFESHPYRQNSNTWARDNLLLTRAEAVEWYRRYYGPNNAVLVVVGDVRTDEVRRLVEKHFAPLPRAPMHGRIEIVEPAPVAETRIRATHAGRASHLEMLYRSPSAFDRDYPAFAASAHLLASALRRALGGDSAGLVAEDTATEYPYVFRLRFRADSTADLDRVVRLVDAEIERLRLGEIGTLGRAPASHDDSPLTGEDSYRALIPPRRSNLTQLADSLLARETLPWEVSPVRRAELRAAERSVGVVQIVDVMRRWFHPWQRVVGTLVPGPDHRVPRHEIPPLTTPPEPRRRPEPVPERALQPLAPIGIFTMRELLPNGIVIRAAQGKAEDGMHVRLTIVSPADSVRLADRIAADPTLRTARVRASRATFTSANLVSPRPPAESMRTLRSAFRPIARVSQPGASAPASPTGRDTVEQRVFVDSATQVDVAGTLPGAPRGHADRRALELLNYIVGVPSYGGRLGWALSKSGLTYASRASATFGVGAGELAFHATCDTRNTDATIQAIREVIAGVGASGVEAWELREAQAFMLGRALLYGARDGSSPEAVAAALALSEESGVEQLDLPAYSRAYLSVTLDEINRVARTYYRADRLKIVATGAVPRVAEPRIFPPGTFRKLFESHP